MLEYWWAGEQGISTTQLLSLKDNYEHLFREGKTASGLTNPKRKSDVIPVSQNENIEIYKVIDEALSPIVHYANDMLFGFNLNSIREYQITRYKVGEFYKPHIDLATTQYKSSRKLSITVQLSDSTDYEGGDFKFTSGIPNPPYDALREKGRVLVFPSFLPHEVEEVTKGTRYSIVGWYGGANWK